MFEHRRLTNARMEGVFPSSRSNEELIPRMKQLGISFSSNFDDSAGETLGSGFYHAWLTRKLRIPINREQNRGRNASILKRFDWSENFVPWRRWRKRRKRKRKNMEDKREKTEGGVRERSELRGEEEEEAAR